MKRLCPERILYADEIDLDQFLSQTARNNNITANVLADFIDDIMNERKRSDYDIADKYGVEPGDFKIGALAAQQKTYFGEG